MNGLLPGKAGTSPVETLVRAGWASPGITPFMLHSPNARVFLVPAGRRRNMPGEVNQFSQGHTTMNSKSDSKALRF